MEVIKIKVATDEEFEKNFWRFEEEKIIEEASKIFYKNFRVGLEMSGKINWQSPAVRNPSEIICYLKGRNTEEMLRDLKEKARLKERDLNKIKEGLEKTKHPQAYLEGYLTAVISRYIETSLDEISRKKEEILWGITGKIPIFHIFSKNTQVMERLGGACLQKRMFVTVLSYASLGIFLHELAHVFGAIHRKRTVMEPFFTGRYLNFDWRNRRIIKANLNKFFKAKSLD